MGKKYQIINNSRSSNYCIGKLNFILLANIDCLLNNIFA